MEHLSGRMIREKVVQQYYFEQFLCGKTENFLPENGFDRYANSKNVKMLHPETIICTDKESALAGFDGAYAPDFILYPSSKSLKSIDELINIEIKWKASDFQKEPHRHMWFKGDTIMGHKQRGFVVAFVDDTWDKNGNRKSFTKNGIQTTWPIDNSGEPVQFVKIDHKHFGDWFVSKSAAIVNQALSDELGSGSYIHRTPKYWIIYIGKGPTRSNYIDIGKMEGVWAFQDQKKSTKLMRMERGDYAIFVHFSNIFPASMVLPANEKRRKKLTSKSGRVYKNNEIDWTIGFCDVFEVTKGYHPDFSTDSFESDDWKRDWKQLVDLRKKNRKNKKVMNKHDLEKERTLQLGKKFTQFIKFDKIARTEKTWDWNKEGPLGRELNREKFPYDDPLLGDFVDTLNNAHRNSLPTEISESSFNALIRLLKS